MAGHAMTRRGVLVANASAIGVLTAPPTDAHLISTGLGPLYVGSRIVPSGLLLLGWLLL